MAMAWALSPALAAAAAAASEVFVPAQIALCCWHSHARQKFKQMCHCTTREYTSVSTSLQHITSGVTHPRLPGQWWLRSRRSMRLQRPQSPGWHRC